MGRARASGYDGDFAVTSTSGEARAASRNKRAFRGATTAARAGRVRAVNFAVAARRERAGDSGDPASRSCAAWAGASAQDQACASNADRRKEGGVAGRRSVGPAVGCGNRGKPAAGVAVVRGGARCAALLPAVQFAERGGQACVLGVLLPGAGRGRGGIEDDGRCAALRPRGGGYRSRDAPHREAAGPVATHLRGFAAVRLRLRLGAGQDDPAAGEQPAVRHPDIEEPADRSQRTAAYAKELLVDVAARNDELSRVCEANVQCAGG